MMADIRSDQNQQDDPMKKMRENYLATMRQELADEEDDPRAAFTHECD